MFKAKTRPRQCPQCRSKRIASILYGMPAFSAKLQADLDAGKVVLGGCCVTTLDPAWQCVECEAQIFKAKDVMAARSHFTRKHLRQLGFEGFVPISNYLRMSPLVVARASRP